MRSVEVLIAGGGAAGMMAALAAKKHGAGVLIIEKMAKPGKKLLATGNGRCNYTNYYQSEECYRGGNTEFIWKALNRFGQPETVDIFKSYGILPLERNGYVYPLSGQASSVRNILHREIIRSGACINTAECVLKAEIHISYKTKEQDGFIIETDKGKYFSKKFIIATGGKSYPIHGSDGSGYELARALGHSVVNPLPALTPCILNEKFTKDWSGVRVCGKVQAYDEGGALLSEDTGELQLVANGISGIPVFQISRFISIELAKGKKPYIILDIMPGFSEGELIDEILYRKNTIAAESIGDIFEGMINNKLAAALLKKCGISVSGNISRLTDKDVKDIVSCMKKWKLDVKASEGFDKAQVTCGGVSVDEIDADTMESKICKGLYFAGEIVDVDGICGGYNLQWAWTSGYIAGAGTIK